VYGNKMSGQIPNLILPALQTINIAFNAFSGTLPPVLDANQIGFAVKNSYMNDNNYNFGSLVGSPLLGGTGTVVYAPQKKIPITLTTGVLEVNTGVPTGSTTQTFYWYKDNAVVAVNNNNWYRPTATGVYRVEVAHSTLTIGTGDKNLILISDNFTVSSLLESNAGRTLPFDLPNSLVDDFNELEKIYDATDGANWTNKTNWLTSGNLALWYGVLMTPDGYDVAALFLGGNNLAGTLPNLNLPNVYRLAFWGNLLTGGIPTITALNLKILDVNSNQLSGDIPNFGFTLNELYLNNNQFVFADMDNKTWLNTPTLQYAPQTNRTLTLNSDCILSVDVRSNVAGQIILWLKDGVEVTRNNSNTYTPLVSGVYSVQVHHTPLTQYNVPTKALILATNTVTVNVIGAPSVSIAASPSTSIFKGNFVVFTATPTNEGAAPQYQWQLNGINIGTNSPVFTINTLKNNDVVKCILTVSETCIAMRTTTSNSLTMTVNCLDRIYVKPIASGNGGGDSWANATSDLQQAIDNACSTTEIWVAAGTYKPIRDAFGNSAISDNRYKTFCLKGGVRLYGGFVGTETSLSQRTPSVIAANPTILSGDFNDNDVTTGNGSTLNTTNNGENAYHVAVSAGTDAASLIDGFIIKGSNANGGGNYVLNGQTLYSNSGGGFYQVGCSVAVSNTVFQDNSAGFGAGLYCNAASPVVTNCIFDKNRVTSHGAAGLNISSAAPVYNNCVFSNGRADGVGGAFYNLLGAAATFKNCTFFGNYAIPSGGVIYNDGSTSTITNGIIWGNVNSGNFGAFNGGTATVTYSSIEGGQSGVGNSASNPQFVNSNNVIGVDNQWFTADDGLQIQNTSPARDAGTNTGAPTSDILGSNIFNTTKDMGAYEFQENIYAGAAACQSVTLTNVSGNQWFYFRHNNAIVAAINPNGMNLGTVTASISDPMGTVNFDNSKFLGRTINFTSSNYADGVTMPSNYALRLYYADGELTELNQLTGGSARLSDFNMAWQQGTSGCTLSSAFNVGILLKNNITTGEYGPNNDGFFMQFPLNHFTVFAPTTSGSQVLPVEILNFSGYTEGGNNLLVWTTANEINNKGFQVERLNCKDTRPCVSTTWESIGFVNSKGKAAIYDFTDKAPFSVSYYRLRQIDNDGKETLSKIISIAAAVDTHGRVYLHPNPATDVLTVEFTKGIGAADKSTTFEVINLFGQIILRGPLNQSVDVSSLPNGTYIVRLSQLPPSLDGGGQEQVKFVKQ
jgi:Secretion system C-terminal sorting domain